MVCKIKIDLASKIYRTTQILFFLLNIFESIRREPFLKLPVWETLAQYEIIF